MFRNIMFPLKNNFLAFDAIQRSIFIQNLLHKFYFKISIYKI